MSKVYLVKQSFPSLGFSELVKGSMTHLQNSVGVLKTNKVIAMWNIIWVRILNDVQLGPDMG